MPHESRASKKPGLWKWLLFGLVVTIASLLWRINEWTRRAAQPAEEPETLRPLASPQPIAPLALQSEGPPQAPAPPQPDDLKEIKGIGPKIMQILNEKGISTFEQLADLDPDFLKDMLAKRNWRMTDPSTWPQQAKDLASRKKAQ